MASASPTRRRVPRAERERQMLEVSARVFAERGYHEASMDEIADRVGVAKPMLYNYFGSKEGLYLAGVQREAETLVQHLADTAGEASGHSPDEQLRAGALAFFRWVRERRAGWAVFYREAAASGGPVAHRVADLRDQLAATVARALRGLLAERGLQDDPVADPDALAHAVVGAGESLANWWLAHRDDPPEVMADRLMAVVWTGLGSLSRRD